MSNIRLMGIIIAVALAGIAFLYFRGPRWSRMNFALSMAFALALFVVSVNPDSVDAIRDALAFGEFEYGRIFAILVVSNVVTFFLAIYTTTKIDALKYLVDRSMLAEALETLAKPKDPLPANGIMIIIPALNESDNLRILLPQIPKQICGLPVAVLVVDDGSHDGTKEVALAHDCYVVRLPINRGQGAASRVGYGVLMRENIRIGVTMDADNQHKPRDIEAMVAPIMAQKYDLVIGSRILGSADRESRTRYLGVILFSHLVSWATGVRITDCSSGFKAFNMTKMAHLDLRQDQFQSSEVLITAAKKGLLIGEVPIHIDRRAHGVSRKGHNLTYGLFFLKAVAKSWWR
jgi:cellulose synthase/poly-beta-1,6-N-acetylglucosamine synthase-like glycosyltransferase